MRFFYTNIPKIKSSRAGYNSCSTLYMPMAIFTTISLIFTTLPMCGMMVYNLFVFSPSNLVFSQSLDSLIVTALVSLVSFLEIVMMMFEIGREKVGFSSISPDISIDNKATPISGDETGRSLDIMCNPSFSLANEGDVYKSRNWQNDENRSLNLKDEEIYSKQSQFEEESIYEINPTQESPVKNYNSGHRENSDSPIFPSSDNSEKTCLPISVTSEKSIHLANPSQLELKQLNLMDHIEDENDIDLNSAEVNENNIDSLFVYHKPSQTQILIKTLFETDIKLDDYDVIEKLPLNLVLRHKLTQEQGILMRNFKKSQIIDINNSGNWHIGQVVRSEADFDIENAVLDPEDPEIIIVNHFNSGLKIKIKKDFKGLPTRDPKTNLPTQTKIHTYDSSTLRIDPNDVHYATLKINGQTLKTRRNFLNAEILDILQEESLKSTKIADSKLNDTSMFQFSDTSSIFQNSPKFVTESAVPNNISLREEDSQPLSPDFSYSASESSTTPKVYSQSNIVNSENSRFLFVKNETENPTKTNFVQDELKTEELGEDMIGLTNRELVIKTKNKKDHREIPSIKELEENKNRKVQTKNKFHLPKIAKKQPVNSFNLNQIHEDEASFGMVRDAAELEFEMLRNTRR